MPTVLLPKSKEQYSQFTFRTGTPTKPTTLWLALCTDEPEADGSDIHEVANSFGYQRIQLNPSDSNWDFTDGLITNLVDLIFGPASGGSWGTVKYITLVTSGTYGSGDPLMYADALIDKTIGDTDSATVAAGNLVWNYNGSP